MPSPVSVQVGFESSSLLENPTWTELVGYSGVKVQGLSISRGRQSELDKTGTGTASITFADVNGVLDPTNAFSSLSANVDPMRQARIRLRNPTTGTWSTIFRGFCVEWLYEMYPTESLSFVTLELADAFDVFARLQLIPGQHGDLPTPARVVGDIYYPDNQEFDDRIVQILDDAGWPGTGTTGSGLRHIFSGNVFLQGSIYSRRDSILTALQDAADAEFPGVANIFVAKDGRVTAHGRLARFSPDDYVTNGILSWKAGDREAFDDDPDVAMITGLHYRRSQHDIRNASIALPAVHWEGTAWSFTEDEVPDAYVSDGDSIAAYGLSPETYSDLLTLRGKYDSLNALQETKLFATYTVDNYRLPRTRVSEIQFRSRGPDNADGSGDPLWALACGVDISHVIHLKTTHDWPGGSGGFDEAFFVEGIHMELKPMREDENAIPEMNLSLDVSPTAYYALVPWRDVAPGAGVGGGVPGGTSGGGGGAAPAPTITSFTPSSGTIGSTVTVTGTDL